MLRIEKGNRAASVYKGLLGQSHVFPHGGTKFRSHALRLIRIFGMYRSLAASDVFF